MELNIILIDFKVGVSYEDAYTCLVNLNYLRGKRKDIPFIRQIIAPFVNLMTNSPNELITELLKNNGLCLAKHDWANLNNHFVSDTRKKKEKTL